jgi:glutathione S-transferase
MASTPPSPPDLPPLPTDAPLTLTTIAISHYCERARWALDLAHVRRTTERRYLPLLHMPALAVLRMYYSRTAGARFHTADKVSSPMSTPLLTGSGSFAPLQDSGDILAAADATLRVQGSATRLFPDDPLQRAEVMRWCALFHDKLGPAVRVYSYYHMLPSVRTMVRMAYANVGVVQASLFTILFPLVRLLLKTALGVTESRAAAGLKRIFDVFEEVTAALAAKAEGVGSGAGAVSGGSRTGGPGSRRVYLVGDSFTAADLTFAALASPLLGIASDRSLGAGYYVPPVEDLPASIQPTIRQLASTRAGEHAHFCYAEHRKA